MKHILIVLLSVGLSQGISASAQDNGRRHGGDGGGFGNSGLPGSGMGSPRDSGEQPALKNRTVKAQRQRKGINRQFPQASKQRSFGNGNRKNTSERGNNFKDGYVNHAQSVSTTAKFQKMGIRSVPQPIQNRSQLLTTNRQHSIITPPRSGPQGLALHASVIAPRAMTGRIVQNHMASITSSTSFRAQINVFNTSEVRRNNYYWHNWNGINYCHYYDPWGYHWYGWYLGPSYFWTRWYGNNWWWYDSAFNRWCYWHDGGWWWQDPYGINAVYVYNNGNYEPINTAFSKPDDNDNNQVVYQSNDGTRKVKVMGDGDAFLYDTSDPPTFDTIYLASDVKGVKFSDTGNGNPLQIILTLKNGSFQMFDASGNRYSSGNSD